MKCKWYAEFEGVCVNGDCPYRGDVCPTSEHMEACKYSENKYEVSELVKILRCGAGDEHKCADCAANLKNKCDRKEANRQAADMLEKLAAEKDAKKPGRISVKDRLLEKESVVRARIGKGQDQTEIISRVAYYNDGITFEGYSLDAIPLSELPKEDESYE
jgi:hypothetical protein